MQYTFAAPESPAWLDSHTLLDSLDLRFYQMYQIHHMYQKQQESWSSYLLQLYVLFSSCRIPWGFIIRSWTFYLWVWGGNCYVTMFSRWATPPIKIFYWQIRSVWEKLCHLTNTLRLRGIMSSERVTDVLPARVYCPAQMLKVFLRAQPPTIPPA